MGEDSVKDLQDELAAEEEPEVEEPGSEEGGEEEGGEGTGDETPDGSDEEEITGTDTKQLAIVIPQFKEVTKKYPDLFKDFPNLRHAFFHSKEYRELFPSIEEAKEAVESLDGYKALEESLISGKPEDTKNILESIAELGKDVVPNFAANFIASIKSINNDLYFQIITPELVNFTRTMFDAGLRNENDNLKNAALVAAMHFFGDAKVASGEKEVKLPSMRKKESAEDEELKKERQNFRNERYSTFYNDVVQSADNQLLRSIMNGIDPKEQMTDGIKEMVAEKVMKEVNKILSDNTLHTSKMDSLWKRAAKDNFSAAWKSKITAAFMEAAKEVMPRVRARVRANTLGIRERHSETSGGGTGTRKRIEPESNAGGSRRSTSNNTPASKDVDWKKTSDLDFIRGNVTLKSK